MQREIIDKILGLMHCRSASVGGVVAYVIVSKLVSVFGGPARVVLNWTR